MKKKIKDHNSFIFSYKHLFNPKIILSKDANDPLNIFIINVHHIQLQEILIFFFPNANKKPFVPLI